MISPIVIVVLAVLGGAGIWMLAAAAAPQRADLSTVLTQDRRPRRIDPTVVVDVDQPRWAERLQTTLEVRLAKTRLTTPDTDLHVVEMTRGRFLVIRVAVALGGLILGPVYMAIFQIMGTGIPLAVPAIAGIGLAAAGWFVPASVVNGKAAARRREMRYALVSYLTLVALHRAAGEGMTGALNRAAESSPAWTFRRIGAQVDSAMRSGMAAWDGLALLAVEMGIDELADLASIADVAGSQGGGVYSTLLARARSLRFELQSQEEADATAASGRMVIPKVGLGLVSMLFLMYPAVLSIGG